MDPRPPIVHLLLTDDCLVVGNQGTPFTADGLVSLCRLGAARQRTREGRKITSEADAEETMRLIREDAVKRIKQAPDQLGQAVEVEQRLRQRMDGYVIRALLQNASDAVTPDAPDGEGVGFSSVLGVSERPRIHSGFLSFCFDASLTRKALGAEGLLGDDGQVPLIRMPFPVSRDGEDERIQLLARMYNTLVVLPLSGLNARDAVVSEWESMVHDISIVQHLPSVRSIIWERDDATEKVRRLCRIGDDGTVETEDIGTFASPEPMIVRGVQPTA